MLSKALIYRREEFGLTTQEVAALSKININDYQLLENPVTRKMSIQQFEKLDKILKLGEFFKKEYVTPYENYGDVLKERRLWLGMSLHKLEYKTGISFQYLWKLENNLYKKLSYEKFKILQPVLGLHDEENFEPFFPRARKAKITFINDGFFGKLVYEKRVALNLSQEEIAASINMDNSLISKIESGNRTSIRAKTAVKIMDDLKFTDEEKKRYLIRQ